MRGLVLGKFLPYHTGHAYLIREARRQVDELVVLVCSIAREPIPGGLRYQWVRTSHPDCHVLHVAEEVPQAPEEAPDFWEIWTALVTRYAGRVDRVFTSEAYGDELGRRLGAVHVPVDPARRVVPISGTAIRRDPRRAWPYVPACVRPHLAHRVAIVGAESSGKTTLAAELAAHFGTTWVPEFGREYSEGRDPRTFAPDDFEAIAWGQATREDAAAATSSGLLICDTELHTTCTWSELILGECRAWIGRAASARRYAGILRMGLDLQWRNDGTRVLEQRRVEHTALLERELRRAGRNWQVIEGQGERRTAAGVAAVDRAVGAIGIPAA